MATRVEASLVLAAYEECSDEHVAGRERYRQLIASFMQKNPHQTVAAANAHVLSKSRTSVRCITLVLDDERKAAYDSGDRTGIGQTRWAGLPTSMRLYYFQGTLQQVDLDVFRRSVAGQDEAKALRMASGKFVIQSAHGIVSAFSQNGLRVLCAPPSVKNTASACMTLSFALSTRANEVLGWNGYAPGMSDFSIDDWVCRFTAGSRSGDPNGAPRPMYHKICVLEPYIIKRLLSLVYVTDKEFLPQVRAYLARAGAFEELMAEAGARQFITMPVDATGGSEKLTFKSMRIISASILPFCLLYLSDAADE